ncbi:integrase [Pandoraea sputorum]|uniref:Integrase n=1 Tax=Pandoraea sputorum TaxID=93222 RepID=A0A5E5BHM1_9BURK|nr:integrase [Pandoraea sputorum]
MQNALWQAGGCPREHRSDSLSAAFKNLTAQEDFTKRYAALLDHYGMEGTRNNRGLGHENGSVESSPRYLKEALDQALMLRGHRDFADRAAYDEFIREVVMRRNRRNAAAFRIERAQPQDLPERRTTDFVEEEARVTRCSTFTVRGILYSAPSRPIGHRLKVRVYGDRLDCYLSGAPVHSTARGESPRVFRGLSSDN